MEALRYYYKLYSVVTKRRKKESTARLSSDRIFSFQKVQPGCSSGAIMFVYSLSHDTQSIACKLRMRLVAPPAKNIPRGTATIFSIGPPSAVIRAYLRWVRLAEKRWLSAREEQRDRPLPPRLFYLRLRGRQPREVAELCLSRAERDPWTSHVSRQ